MRYRIYRKDSRTFPPCANRLWYLYHSLCYTHSYSTTVCVILKATVPQSVIFCKATLPQSVLSSSLQNHSLCYPQGYSTTVCVILKATVPQSVLSSSLQYHSLWYSARLQYHSLWYSARLQYHSLWYSGYYVIGRLGCWPALQVDQVKIPPFFCLTLKRYLLKTDGKSHIWGRLWFVWKD